MYLVWYTWCSHKTPLNVSFDSQECVIILTFVCVTHLDSVMSYCRAYVSSFGVIFSQLLLGDTYHSRSAGLDIRYFIK